MLEGSVLDALADAADAAAAVLRRHAAQQRGGTAESDGQSASAVDLAKASHPMLGFRQEQVLTKLVEAGPDGTTTGAISSALEYDQPNTHITLQALVERGFAEKDTSVYPHIYRLGRSLRATQEGSIVRREQYERLGRHLQADGGERIEMTFKEVAEIIGARLPNSAYQHPAWWGSDPKHTQAVWLDAGYVAHPNLTTERVTFTKQ
jgi:DNA-binding MarR family transcriptional regulator